ncbi:MAG: hypothetical protein KDA84_09630, partial [Planctomycetaceae bacterium]|nr:hypothetical protein [Planctomycetaceae bacterium]
GGKQYPKPKMNINGFDDPGKLLPLVTITDAGEEKLGDKNVMTYQLLVVSDRFLTTDLAVVPQRHAQPGQVSGQRVQTAVVRLAFFVQRTR